LEKKRLKTGRKGRKKEDVEELFFLKSYILKFCSTHGFCRFPFPLL